MTEGLKFATASTQQAWELARFDSADVTLVDDPEVCGRVSRALGRVPPGPEIPGRERRPTYSDVVVVRLGRAGYLVSSFWHISKAGEFLCARALMSPRFTDTQWLCG